MRIFVSKRRAFTLIEVSIVVIIVAIAAAVAVPRFQKTNHTISVRSARLRLLSDVVLLKRWAITSSQRVSARFNDQVLRIDPASPTMIGNQDGVCDYDVRIPEASIATVSFDGSNVFMIDHRGDLRSQATGELLSTARIVISVDGSRYAVNLPIVGFPNEEFLRELANGKREDSNGVSQSSF